MQQKNSQGLHELEAEIQTQAVIQNEQYTSERWACPISNKGTENTDTSRDTRPTRQELIRNENTKYRHTNEQVGSQVGGRQ